MVSIFSHAWALLFQNTAPRKWHSMERSPKCWASSGSWQSCRCWAPPPTRNLLIQAQLLSLSTPPTKKCNISPSPSGCLHANLQQGQSAWSPKCQHYFWAATPRITEELRLDGTSEMDVICFHHSTQQGPLNVSCLGQCPDGFCIHPRRKTPLPLLCWRLFSKLGLTLAASVLSLRAGFGAGTVQVPTVIHSRTLADPCTVMLIIHICI